MVNTYFEERGTKTLEEIYNTGLLRQVLILFCLSIPGCIFLTSLYQNFWQFVKKMNFRTVVFKMGLVPTGSNPTTVCKIWFCKKWRSVYRYSKGPNLSDTRMVLISSDIPNPDYFVWYLNGPVFKWSVYYQIIHFLSHQV